ncbi:hypothetical protein EIP86_003880 [Pleurotus ostreatoroseus]|nr:hypothetical protein EIP86_003880 [Pleurotus ostreatoroseus]
MQRDNDDLPWTMEQLTLHPAPSPSAPVVNTGWSSGEWGTDAAGQRLWTIPPEQECENEGTRGSGDWGDSGYWTGHSPWGVPGWVAEVDRGVEGRKTHYPYPTTTLAPKVRLLIFSKHWQDRPTPVIVPLSERWLELVRMPKVLKHFDVNKHAPLEIWTPVRSEWRVLDPRYKIYVFAGETSILMRTGGTSIRNVSEEIRACTESGVEALADPTAKDFTLLYKPRV